jgi:hypothetical protein
MKSEFRPISTDERQELESYLRLRTRGVGVFFINWLFVGGLTTLIIVFAAGRMAFVAAHLALILIACSLLAAIFVHYLSKTRSKLSDGDDIRLAITSDLENGVVEVCTCNVEEALAVEEFEDEGTSFYLKIGTREALFVGGQNLDDLAAEKKFPSTSVQLVRSPKSQIPLALEPLGTYLAPVGKRQPFTKHEFKENLVPSHGDVLQIDFESLKQTVGIGTGQVRS